MCRTLFISIILMLILFSYRANAYGSQAGTCEINANYSSDFGAMGRRLNYFSTGYDINLNSGYYTNNEIIEITISGPTFTGIVFVVVDENDSNVGTFDSSPGIIQNCSSTVAITHTGSFGNQTSYTLFWIPPENDVGKVYVEGYILKGERGQTGSQEFFRFVKEDTNPVSLLPRDVFASSFE